jgi:hypothetical protein
MVKLFAGEKEGRRRKVGVIFCAPPTRYELADRCQSLTVRWKTVIYDM